MIAVKEILISCLAKEKFNQCSLVAVCCGATWQVTW